MECNILQVENITKKYKDFYALNDVSFSIKQGEIFGLIGENGAGKSSLMRIIAGASKEISGKVVLLGKTGKELSSARKHMGVIIENPSYYGDMSAIENLELIRLAKGLKEKEIVLKTLQMVGLSEFATRKVGKFSLGMRQRLGLASVLIGSPKFIILDEPTNGLDPNGIVDIRNTILRLNQEYGITFLISSHILTELHQVATKYGILHKGQLKAEYTSKELEKQCRAVHILRHREDVSKILEYLKRFHIEIVLEEENKLIFTTREDIPEQFLKQLIQEDFNIIEYHMELETLEEYFVRLTQKGGK